MAMLGGDKRLIDAHNQAVTEAVRQLETLAATRVMTDGKSETVLTGNLIVANSTTTRIVTRNLRYTPMPSSLTPRRTGTNGSLSAQIRSVKTGFIENVYANQIAFGKLYREAFKPLVEKLGYETELWANTGCGR